MKRYGNKGTGMWTMILGGLNLVFIGMAISGSVTLDGVTEATASVNQANQRLQTSNAGSGVMPEGLPPQKEILITSPVKSKVLSPSAAIAAAQIGKE